MLKIRTLIVNILIALAAGGASAFLTRDSMAEYEAASDSCLNDVFVRADGEMYERKRALKEQKKHNK